MAVDISAPSRVDVEEDDVFSDSEVRPAVQPY
jgi:hypothetical protein